MIKSSTVLSTKGKHWLKSEVEKLKIVYSKLSWDELEKEFNRDRVSIKGKVYWLNRLDTSGIKRPYDRKNIWRENEINIVKTHYPTASKSIILNKLKKRKWAAVKCKACDFKINRLLCARDMVPSRLILKKATDYEIGFIVALIDGEGTITCTSPYKPNMHPDPYIVIANTNLEILEYAKTIMGGAIYCHRKNIPKHWKTPYRLHLADVKMVFLTLCRIGHLFIVKRENARIVKEMCRIRLTLNYRSKIDKREMELLKELRATKNKPSTST